MASRHFLRTKSRVLGVAVLSLGILGAVGADATLTGATDARVSFQAAGTGMKIEGTTGDLTVSDDGTNVVITVPLANLVTGIGLRDRHMKEKYLEVQKFPAATLTIPRTSLKVPRDGEQSAADVTGTFQLHGQTHPVALHYEAKGEGASVQARGTFRVNMNDFGITVPSYLGVTVKPDVDVSAGFHVTGP